MPHAKSPSGIFEWILEHTRPAAADSATLRFERMTAQGCGRLPEIDVPLDPGNPGHWHHRGLILDYALALAGARRVLDIGSGDGWPSLLLAPHFPEVIGIEPGEVRLGVCRSNAIRLRLDHVRFEQMSACRMTFPPASFDGVVAASAIEQTPDPLAALREVFRVLKPGGVLRLSFEVFPPFAEPVRETVSLKADGAGAYLLDYSVAWPDQLEQRDYLVEIVPATDATEKRLALWAERCAQDDYPHRDPRLERGLTRSVKALGARDVRRARSFRLHHFKPERLVATLTRIGFVDPRLIAGGGRPAGEIARELVRLQRIAAAAPLMEELCRGAARIGLALGDPNGGQLIARKPERVARRARPSRA
jgi:ubiquinone/menaquinone biosynthesis C-methylase UbiE